MIFKEQITYLNRSGWWVPSPIFGNVIRISAKNCSIPSFCRSNLFGFILNETHPSEKKITRNVKCSMLLWLMPDVRVFNFFADTRRLILRLLIFIFKKFYFARRECTSRLLWKKYKAYRNLKKVSPVNPIKMLL